MESYRKQNWTGVAIISTQKIWYNVKHLWWICLLFFGIYGAFLGLNVWKTYQQDLNAVHQDTYQASIQIYYPHDTEEEEEGFIVTGESNRVISALNESLTENGYMLYGEGIGDNIEIQAVGNSFGTTVIAEGEARARFIAQTFGEIMVEVAQEVMGKDGGLMGDATVFPCVVRANGTTVVFDSLEEKSISFSLLDYVSWKKIMLLFATVLVGGAVIFVVILFDEKIRAKEELDAAFSLPCIAVIQKKKTDSLTMFATITGALCHNKGIANLILVSPEKNNGMEILQTEMNKIEGVSLISRENALTSPETIEECANADGVIVMIQRNRDRMDKVGQAISNMELVGSHLLGYVLVD